jgi:hypothetical protein
MAKLSHFRHNNLMLLTQLATQIFDTPQRLLPRRQWPVVIFPPYQRVGGFLGFGAKNKFWLAVQELRQFTDKEADSFSENHQGSTGWEYSQLLVWFQGQIYYSSVNSSRDYQSVTSANAINVYPDFDAKNYTLADKLYVDSKYVGAEYYYGADAINHRNELIQQNKYQLGFLMHLHTHPQMKLKPQSPPYYSWFSLTDINSFRVSNYPLLGLVTDRLWVLGKTPEFMNLPKEELLNFQRDLNVVSQAEIAGENKLRTAASDFCSKYELVCYTAQFGQSWERV